MSQSSILVIYSEREDILIDPEYQRNGDIWNKEKKQLLIDSIINKYDIPKIYFNVVDGDYKYAVIDGRQRLEAIWQFIDNRYALSDEIVYYDDSDVDLRGLYYKDISEKYPRIKIRFDGYSLPIVEVKVNDIELIDDMFSRLNEAVPLNAAEKRNAIGGDMARAIRDLSKHSLFAKKIRFGNNRYQYYEAVAKLLLIEDSLVRLGAIVDTKKVYLDNMVRTYRQNRRRTVDDRVTSVTAILNVMDSIFLRSDILLRTQASVPVYYLFIKYVYDSGGSIKGLRGKLLNFMEAVRRNRETAENDIAAADFSLLEYSRLSIQGTNDANSIKERVEILMDKVDV